MATQQNTTDQATTIAGCCAQARELLEQIATNHYSRQPGDTPERLYSIDQLLSDIEDAIATSKAGV